MSSPVPRTKTKIIINSIDNTVEGIISNRGRQPINLRLQSVQEQIRLEDATSAPRAARRMRRLHQKLERKNEVRRWPSPQLLSCPRGKFDPPLWRRDGVVMLCSVALHATKVLGWRR